MCSMNFHNHTHLRRFELDQMFQHKWNIAFMNETNFNFNIL